MTEEQHIALVEVGNRFYKQMSKLVAESVSQFPEDLEGDVLCYLQDKTSVYGLDFRQLINRKQEEPPRTNPNDPYCNDLA